jgi:UDP-N-acetylmuramate dehydrogenase
MPENIPPCPFEQNVSLSKVGYFAIGGLARWFATPRSVQELASLLLWCRRRELPVIVTGKGSNMLFSDDGFPGVVISTASMNRMFRISERQFFFEAGVENSDVALELLDAGRSGGEWLYRLPGMIGATVRMNGRCYGREVSEVTVGIVTVGLDGTVRWREKEEVFLGYKQTSLMRGREIVAGVILEFPESKPAAEIRAAMDEYERDRHGKHQFDFPSCGSTFKNSYAAGRPSGQIFESLGFKGRRLGGAKVSDHHANFIFNTGAAKAEEVLGLAAAMRTAARERAGAELELEVQCAGLFDASLLDACGIVSIPDPLRPGFAWAGLLQAHEETGASFPRMLMQGPLLDYSGEALHFPDVIRVELEQLFPLSEARLDPGRPFLRWTTRDRSGNSFPLRPEVPGGTFVDRLWSYSVSELFVACGAAGDAYSEFEVTPGSHWVALRFDAPRLRAAGHEVPSQELWGDDVKPFTDAGAFGMELSFELLEPFIRDGELSLQCCASLGESRYGLFPWWNDAGAPDFHQPRRFCPVRLA